MAIGIELENLKHANETIENNKEILDDYIREKDNELEQKLDQIHELKKQLKKVKNDLAKSILIPREPIVFSRTRVNTQVNSNIKQTFDNQGTNNEEQILHKSNINRIQSSIITPSAENKEPTDTEEQIVDLRDTITRMRAQSIMRRNKEGGYDQVQKVVNDQEQQRTHVITDDMIISKHLFFDLTFISIS